MKAITAKNPLKAGIVSALKALAGATKVTCVVEEAPGTYSGHCLNTGAPLGYFKVLAVKSAAGVLTHYVAAPGMQGYYPCSVKGCPAGLVPAAEVMAHAEAHGRALKALRAATPTVTISATPVEGMSFDGE
jgi:hypothetical protein